MGPSAVNQHHVAAWTMLSDMRAAYIIVYDSISIVLEANLPNHAHETANGRSSADTCPFY